MGNSQDIDIAAEQQALAVIPDADTKFLVKPSRREFDRELWDNEGWDILFFAGHSQQFSFWKKPRFSRSQIFL